MIRKNLFQKQILDIVQIGSLSATLWCNTI